VAALARYWVYDRTEVVRHDPESVRLARSLAETGQFANPFVPLDTGPSAHSAPVFPALLALLMRVFGDGITGMYAIKLTAVLMLSAQLALFPVFSRLLGMGELNGIIGAILWITARVGTGATRGHQEVAMFVWESFYAAILVIIATCSFRRYLDASLVGSRRLAWLLGCAIGTLMLTCPTGGVILVGFIGLLLWRDKMAIFKNSHVVIIMLLPIVIVAPWIIRNYSVFDRFILVRDNLGLELSVSNNDCAMFGIQQNIDSGCFAKVHPNANIDEARSVLANGEPTYNDLKLREALHWINTHPARFFRLCALRVAAFWMPPATAKPYSLVGPGRRLERTAVYVMTLLSVAGLFILYRRDILSLWLCLICLGLFPLIYYTVQYEYRYRYPILWATFLLGSLPITAFVQRAYIFLSSRPRSASCCHLNAKRNGGAVMF
jgi:hypothetical protein